MSADHNPACPENSQLLLWHYGELEPDAHEPLRAHLDTCARCRAALAELETTLAAYDATTAAAPEPERYREMIAEATRSAPRVSVRAPSRPRWAIAALIIVTFGAGIVASRLLWPTAVPVANPAVSTVDLQASLTTGSTHERLQAVIAAAVLSAPPDQIVSALVDVLATDPSTNVRLAVVDALRGHRLQPDHLTLLLDAFAEQETPLVRKAVIELYVALDLRESEPLLRRIADNDPERSVRAHARWALEHLS